MLRAKSRASGLRASLRGCIWIDPRKQTMKQKENLLCVSSLTADARGDTELAIPSRPAPRAVSSEL